MRFPSPLHLRRCAAAVLLATFSFSLSSWPVSSAQDHKPVASPLEEQQILHHLNSVITWYRKTKTQIQPVGLPTDALYQTSANRIGAEVVSFAFASAEKAAPLLPSESAQ